MTHLSEGRMRTRSPRRLLLLPLLFGTLVATALVPALYAQGATTRRSVRGDTTVMSAPAVGPWGPRRAAVEVARIVGTPDGEPFGMLAALAALPDGGVVIFDAKGANGAVVLVLDADGRIERRIGREGSGPGEYRHCNDCLASNADGSIGLLDNQNRRITTYDRSGTVRSTTPLPTGVGFGLPPQFLAAPAGSYYARLETTPRPATPITDPQEYDRFGYVRIAEGGGVLDTIRPPASWVARPARSLLEPRTLWRPLPDGRVAVGGTDRLRVLLRGSAGARNGLVLIEGSARRIAFGTEERKAYQAIAKYANAYRRVPPSRQTPLPAEPPELKPVFRDFDADHAGRLFVQLHSRAVRAPAAMIPQAAVVMSEGGGQLPPAPILDYLEPPLFAVFERDGKFLGEVEFPVNASRVSFSGDFAWVILKEDDGDVLVRFALPRARP